ncbi:small kinetochore-associated protein [Bombina bombina]|uniref:small kinetochore-associated protein n=1 Tax=Bombina bombina TaxID=8345 RepID=UPI00235AE978|nr:small kinetochore-associated protein [Bombina bombina]
MDKSKIPIPKSNVVNTSQKLPSTDSELAYPCLKKTCPPKPVLPLYSKDPNINFTANVPDNGVFKATTSTKRTVVNKKAAAAPTRGPVTRYRLEAELKDRNQLLEAANISLHNSLTNAQETIKQMTEHEDEQKEEIKELNRRLEKNLIILESRNIDPVSGELILASAEEKSKLRAETKASTDNLLSELKIFGQMANEQIAQVQAVIDKWNQAEENRNVFLEEQKDFDIELDQFRAALQQAEQWLDL